MFVRIFSKDTKCDECYAPGRILVSFGGGSEVCPNCLSTAAALARNEQLKALEKELSDTLKQLTAARNVSPMRIRKE
jgi:recombinational DNA repair protein (RecF pathway)